MDASSDVKDVMSKSSSSRCECFATVAGTSETIPSSFSFSMFMLLRALVKNECRADVKDSSMGVTMYLEVAYAVAATLEVM